MTVEAVPEVSSAAADVFGLEVGSSREMSLSGVFSDAVSMSEAPVGA